MSAARYRLWQDLPADHVLAEGGEGTRTFATLWADVQQVATLLPPAGADATGNEVLIVCADRYRFTVALFAAWVKGYAAALPPAHRAATLGEIACGGRIAITLHDGEATSGLDLREVPASAHKDLALSLPDIAGDTHLVTLYTSGSTGAPTRVQKTAAQIFLEVDTLAHCFGDDLRKVLCTVPPRHIYGLLFGVLLPLRVGGAFLRETPLHTDTLLSLLHLHAADTLIGVPAHLSGVARVTREALGGLRHVFSSGAPLGREVFDALTSKLGLRVTEVLGSTETGGIGYREGAADPFRAFPGICVEASAGQLLLRSVYLAPELAQPHACEDRIELVTTDTFRHLGRSDDIVKIGGSRASLRAIEERVLGLPGVVDAALIAREIPNTRGKELLLAVVGADWNADRMRQALSAFFDPVVLPRRYRFVAELPREATGKLRKGALIELFEGVTDKADFERLRTQRNDDRVLIELRVPADHSHFRGHFDAWPVLPGVSQVGLLAVREALAAWPDLRALRRAQRLKFKLPIERDQKLTLELRRLAEARVDFSIERDGALCSSGRLFFSTQGTP